MRVIDRVLRGDADAFEALVKAYQTQVYNLALRMVGNEQDAFDLAQEAFLRAWRSLESFRGESRFSVWLYRLTSNVCLDFLRARQRQRTIPLSALAPEAEDAEPEIPDERYAPETLLEKQTLREELRAALAELPLEQRQILLLREVGGLRYDEIAAALSLESGTVKSRIFRARRALCEILQRSGNFSAFPSSKKAKGGVRDEVL